MVASKEAATKTGASVALPQELPLEIVRQLRTPEDVEKYFASQGVVLSSGEEISDGYEKLEDKDMLLKTPFIIVDWRPFYSAEFTQYVMTIRLMTLQGARYRMSDGSTGIYSQLEEVTRVREAEKHKTPNAGLIVKGGLSKSEYWIEKNGGRIIPAGELELVPEKDRRKGATYYLSF